MTYCEKYLKRRNMLFCFVHDIYDSWKNTSGIDISFGEWLDKEIDEKENEYTVYCHDYSGPVLRKETGTLCELRDKFLYELHSGQKVNPQIKTKFKSIIGLVNALNDSYKAEHIYSSHWYYKKTSK